MFCACYHQTITSFPIIFLSELTENMRQKKDKVYAERMSRFRLGSPSDDDIKALMARFISVLTGKGI
jgi:hypothetical protein